MGAYFHIRISDKSSFNYFPLAIFSFLSFLFICNLFDAMFFNSVYQKCILVGLTLNRFHGLAMIKLMIRTASKIGAYTTGLYNELLLQLYLAERRFEIRDVKKKGEETETTNLTSLKPPSTTLFLCQPCTHSTLFRSPSPIIFHCTI